ncbi:MAG: ABC transporter permease [Chloroflexota bacterium]
MVAPTSTKSNDPEAEPALSAIGRGRSAADRSRAIEATRFGLIAAVLVVWEGLVRAGWWDAGFISSPSLIIAKLAMWVASGYLWPQVLVTLEEVAIGFALGLVAAIGAGFALGRNAFLAGVFEPMLAALNAVPRIVLAPLLILWFGIGVESKVALTFLMVFFVVVFAVLNGIREVNQALVQNARILGATERQLDRFIYFPAALTWIFGSLRLAIGFGFSAAIVGEFLLSSRGLGYLLNAAQNAFDATSMMAALVTLMAIIGVLTYLAGRIERRASLWKTTAGSDR